MWVRVVALGNHLVLDPVSFAALGGGFPWVVSDELGRFRTRDFTTYDVYNFVFRLLLSIPLGFTVEAFVDTAFKIPVAFLLGTFPTSTLFTIARRLGNEKLNLADDETAGGSELELLPDVGRAFAERLKDDGINSITELAYADPVNLTIRTKPYGPISHLPISRIASVRLCSGSISPQVCPRCSFWVYVVHRRLIRFYGIAKRWTQPRSGVWRRLRPCWASGRPNYGKRRRRWPAILIPSFWSESGMRIRQPSIHQLCN